MSAFWSRNNEEYIEHVILVLRLLDQKGTKSDILKAFKVVKEIAKKLKPLATPLPSDAAKLVKEEQNCRCPLCQRNCRPLGMGPLCKS